MEDSELAELMKLADQTRTIDGAFQAVDPQRTVFLSRIGRLRGQVNNGSMTTTTAEAAERKLADEFRSEMQAILSAGHYVAPQVVILAPTLHEQAASALNDLRALGVQINASPSGLALHPASKLTPQMKQRVIDLRDHLLPLLDVLLVPVAKPAKG